MSKTLKNVSPLLELNWITSLSNENKEAAIIGQPVLHLSRVLLDALIARLSLINQTKLNYLLGALWVGVIQLLSYLSWSELEERW